MRLSCILGPLLQSHKCLNRKQRWVLEKNTYEKFQASIIPGLKLYTHQQRFISVVQNLSVVADIGGGSIDMQDERKGQLEELLEVELMEVEESASAGRSMPGGKQTSKEASTKEEFEVCVQVDRALLRYVKGLGGQVKEKIERETGACVVIPCQFGSKEQTNRPVVVKGHSMESVRAAVTAVEQAVEEAIEGPALGYSHFVSIPLAVHPELVTRLFDLRESILRPISVENLTPFPPNLNFEKWGTSNAAQGSKHGRTSSRDELGPGPTVERGESRKGNGLDCHGSGSELREARANMVRDEMRSRPLEDKEDGSEETIMLQPKRPDDSEGNVSSQEEDRCRAASGEDGRSGARNLSRDNIGIRQVRPPQGVDESIFIKPATFHLTVQMLKLWNEERVDRAARVLQEAMPLVHEALEGRPLAIRLGGLTTMRGSPAKAHVLYAQVAEIDGGDRLTNACQVLMRAYQEAGLVTKRDQQQPLKLHATVMNTSHRKASRSKKFKRVAFDARSILEQHGASNWGEYQLTEFHLSQRFVFDSTGYYNCCGKICFPH